MLHVLAVPRAFGEMEDEMIRNQLIEHEHLCLIRGRLLLEDDLTLQWAVTLACQVESVVQNAISMGVLLQLLFMQFISPLPDFCNDFALGKN